MARRRKGTSPKQSMKRARASRRGPGVNTSGLMRQVGKPFRDVKRAVNKALPRGFKL